MLVDEFEADLESCKFKLGQVRTVVHRMLTTACLSAWTASARPNHLARRRRRIVKDAKRKMEAAIKASGLAFFPAAQSQARPPAGLLGLQTTFAQPHLLQQQQQGRARQQPLMHLTTSSSGNGITNNAPLAAAAVADAPNVISPIPGQALLSARGPSHPAQDILAFAHSMRSLFSLGAA